MQTPGLELKGASFTLSVLHITTSVIEDIAKTLDEKLAIAPQFFLGAPLVLNLAAISKQPTTPVFDLNALQKLLVSRELVIVGITAANEQLNQQAKTLGLAIVKSGKQSSTAPSLTKPLQPVAKKTKIVKQTIRSGQQIYGKNSDLIIFGSVSNGAEAIADGSIHIYGSLRGKAMAGASGDTNSVIIANTMDAELVSIAGQYWLTENIQQNSSTKSGCIRLEGESLTYEAI